MVFNIFFLVYINYKFIIYIKKSSKLMKQFLNNTLKVLMDQRLLYIFILGIVSGMPLSILITLFSTYLKENGFTVAAIGFLTTARLPYSFKYVWAPFLDHIKLPLLYKILGRRKSWMLIANFIIIASLLSLRIINNINYVFPIALTIGFAAATFDIAYDAFRIEILRQEEQGFGAATAVFGYRVGMLIAGSVGLILAEHLNWYTVFTIIAGIFMVGGIVVLLAKEAEVKVVGGSIGFNLDSVKTFILDPLYDFFKKDYSILILSAIILYKLGEVMLGSVLQAFYLDLGFTKQEIGVIIKLFGFYATIFGTYIGAIIVKRYGNLKSLLFCGFFQMVSNLIFIWQHHMGHSTQALTLSISVENITGGMGSTALVAYIGYLCNKNYTATQYALLSSMASIMNNSIGAFGGLLAENLGWDMFFVFTVAVSMPALVVLYILNKKLNMKTKGI